MANLVDDKDRGLYSKYIVVRVDGSTAPGGRHAGCSYFVLDVDHDPHALPALEAYAKSCEETHPILSRDLRLWVEAKKS